MSSLNPKTTRIARNTAMLYVRMFVMMVVSLYTYNVIIGVLGLKGYGLYNLVGGVVALFGFINVAMGAATQRFLNHEMEVGTAESVSRVFSMSVNIHAAIALVVLVLGETVGLWFVNNGLDGIPSENMVTANWVYQIALLTACISIFRVPYNASIIAHERMSFFAVVSLVEAVLTLAAAFMLRWVGYDKVITHAVFVCGVVLAVTLVYRGYCKRRFDTCNYRFEKDKSLFRKMISFSGWSLFGGGSVVAVQKGLDFIVNNFFGLMVNGALAIATGVSTQVYAFVVNFQLAFNPQIVKSYAGGDRSYFLYLIFRASKYAYFLLLLVALPVMLYAETILQLWLDQGHIPFAAAFCRIMILLQLTDAISGPLWTAVTATGRIRNYQIIMSVLMLLNIPLAYLVLKMGWRPESILVVRVAVNLASYIGRIIYLKHDIDFPAGRYFGRVVLVTLGVTALSVPLPLVVACHTSGLWGLVVTTAVSCVCVGCAAFFAGMGRAEREFFISRIRKVLHRGR